MGYKHFKTRQEHDDELRSEENQQTEEKIRMMRKQMGKKNQRRGYEEESSAPKRRRVGESSFRRMRNATGDIETECGGKRKPDETENVYQKQKERKTQTLMENYMIKPRAEDRAEPCLTDQGAALSRGRAEHHDIPSSSASSTQKTRQPHTT